MIVGFLAIIALEVPAMAAKGQKGEQRAFWALLALGLATGVAVVLRLPVPNPVRLMAAVFKPIAQLMGLK